MKRLELEVKPRDLGQKDVKRNLSQLRGLGWVPGVIYGHGDPVPVAIEGRAFKKAIQTVGSSALFTVKLGSESSLSQIKEIQRDLLSHEPIHVDFLRINLKEKIEANLPVHTQGEAPGVKTHGGILEHIQREIRVRCLPDDMPSSIDVDISQLNIGQGIKVADLTPPKGVEFLTPGDHIVVNVVAPKVEEVKPATPAEGAAAAAGEPEVIAKGKKEEGEGAAAPAAGAAPAAAPAEKKK